MDEPFEALLTQAMRCGRDANDAYRAVKLLRERTDQAIDAARAAWDGTDEAFRHRLATYYGLGEDVTARALRVARLAEVIAEHLADEREATA